MAIEEVRECALVLQTSLLTIAQEFSIEIPDKEADAIHSGMLPISFNYSTRQD